MILTIDDKGFTETEDDLLPYGTYQVYELRMDAQIKAGDAYGESTKLGSSAYANTCYMWDGWSDTKEIHSENTILSFHSSHSCQRRREDQQNRCGARS